MNKLVSKLPAGPDELVGAGVSGMLTTSPLWLTPVTEWLQMITLLVGIIVGISVYRLNTARRKELERKRHD